jgi:hypothetical protein
MFESPTHFIQWYDPETTLTVGSFAHRRNGWRPGLSGFLNGCLQRQ